MTSSSSIVVLLSVDSFTFEPSLFLLMMLRPVTQKELINETLYVTTRVFLLEKFRVASIVVKMAPLKTKQPKIRHPNDLELKTVSTFNLRRALNFFKQSTVSCRCTTDATRSRCCEKKERIEIRAARARTERRLRRSTGA